MPCEKWFAAVEDDKEFGQVDCPCIFSDTLCKLAAGFLGHQRRLLTPTLVGVFVHVAIVTRQVATGCNLDEDRANTGRGQWVHGESSL
jgi:hypothetical protein